MSARGRNEGRPRFGGRRVRARRLGPRAPDGYTMFFRARTVTLTRLAVTGALVVAIAAVTSGPSPAGAVTIASITPALAGGHIGIDGAAVGQSCPGYGGCVFWNASGAVTPSVAGLPSGPGIRLELYPHVGATGAFGTYDPWTAAAGGAYVSPRGPDVGDISLPTPANGAVRTTGTVIAHDGVSGGRLHIEASQYDNLRTTSGGQEEGAFVSVDGHGGQYSLGFVWKATYLVHITDQATGVAVFGFMNVGDALPTIDLDAVCFGLAICHYEAGSFGSVAGGYHPVSPTRILDTRVPLGITNGPLRQGDGRMFGEPDNARRADELVNHELQVTGTAGIPASGASAVVLNVTASQPSDSGFVSVYPSLTPRHAQPVRPREVVRRPELVRRRLPERVEPELPRRPGRRQPRRRPHRCRRQDPLFELGAHDSHDRRRRRLDRRRRGRRRLRGHHPDSPGRHPVRLGPRRADAERTDAFIGCVAREHGRRDPGRRGRRRIERDR